MYELLGQGPPKICLSLTEATLDEDLAIVEQERKRVDLVELRADFLSESELTHLARFPESVGLPTILTYRRADEGGDRSTPEPERIKVLERSLEGLWTFVDLEEDLAAPRLDSKAADHGTKIIRSLFDFSGIPSNLADRIGALPRNAGEIPKATVMPQTTSDLLDLLVTARRIGEAKAILVGMGEWGLPTVVLPNRFASLLTYSTAGRANSGPGHLPPETLRSIYRIGEVGTSARIFCVIGNPVLHSRSPWIHNPGLRSLGLDAVYIPIRVDSISAFMQLAEELPIDGVSVTIPHKEAIIDLLGSSDRSVGEVGACNTLVRYEQGWKGYNTDIEGFLVPLRSRLQDRLRGRTVLVVGAGGAARAVVAGLVRSGSAVTIVNRTHERAEKLARQFGCNWIRANDVRDRGSYDVVVQATSVGMTPNVGGDPLPSYRFRGSEVVYDLIYAPPRTEFLRRAASAGCALIGGGEMLLHQAYAQFRLFTGNEYPSEATEAPEV